MVMDIIMVMAMAMGTEEFCTMHHTEAMEITEGVLFPV
jgi:hypothetical protein